MFQSTHSLRSATLARAPAQRTCPVSIHALLAECDPRRQSWQDPLPGFNPRTPCGVRQELPPLQGHSTGFNPRTPCGVRHQAHQVLLAFLRFQSTHSLRSATDQYSKTCNGKQVSIHALLAECDVGMSPMYNAARSFNPRTPCGVRLLPFEFPDCSTWFQSTHSLRSATGRRPGLPCSQSVSIHALLAECDCA